MNRRLFFSGFGVTLALIAVCAWYAFVSPESRAVLDGFDAANRGWYVNLPKPYGFALMAFAVLNVPVVLVAWALLRAADALGPLSAPARAAITFVSFTVLAAGWWALLARWKRR